jgi:glutathione S-transferase
MRILHHLPLSPFSRKVRLALAEKRLTFELRAERPWEQRPEFLALSPLGTVPTLVDENGLVVSDSSVICEYLEEAYPDTPLLGRSVVERIEIRRVTAWVDYTFGINASLTLLHEKVMKRHANGGQPDVARLRHGYDSLRRYLPTLGHLAETRRWLGGETLSLADFAAAAHLSSLDYVGELDWTLVPPIHDWYARIKSRPCFRALLTERVPGIVPPEHYPDLDF